MISAKSENSDAICATEILKNRPTFAIEKFDYEDAHAR